MAGEHGNLQAFHLQKVRLLQDIAFMSILVGGDFPRCVERLESDGCIFRCEGQAGAVKEAGDGGRGDDLVQLDRQMILAIEDVV